VTVVTPSLASNATTVNVFSGQTGAIEISAAAGELGAANSVTATVPSGITLANSSVTPVDGVASYSFTAGAAGVYKVTFATPGFKSVSVSVVVTRPALKSDASSVSAISGSDVTFSVSSDDVDLPDSLTLTPEVKNSAIGTATVATPSEGAAVVTFHALTAGVTTITVKASNFKSVVVKVTVASAGLSVDTTSVVSVVHGVTKVEVTSPEIADFAPALITPTVSKSNVVSVVLDAGASDDGKAVFTVTGTGKGSAKITFTSPGFKAVAVPVKVNTAMLAASTSSLQVFTGTDAEVVISSPDLELDETMSLSTSDSVGIGTGAGKVASIDTSYADGQATITITGLAKGRAKLVVGGTGYQKVTVTINVVEPVLVTNLTAVSFRADGSATLQVSSNDLPFVDADFDPTSIEVFPVTATGVVLDAATDVTLANGIATIKLKVDQGILKANGTVLIKVPHYKSKSIKVTVTPVPVCTADKSLGQIKFGDTSALLSVSAKANVARFAATLKNNGCTAVNLITYVPVPEANAAKYAKELVLSADRLSAVKTELEAELTKLGGNVTVTSSTGVVDAGDLAGSAAKQSKWRRIDVISNPTPTDPPTDPTDPTDPPTDPEI
jgi:hypothetical protein